MDEFFIRNYSSITFVIPVNNDPVYKKNFLRSPMLRQIENYHKIEKRGYGCEARAYNEAIDSSMDALIIFALRDVIFRRIRREEIKKGLDCLDKIDVNGGVLGCYGITEDGKPLA